jgi:hypothetical protein
VTPEGKVKAKISAYLKSLAPNCCYKMPVSNGFGKSGVDYDVTYYGMSIAIEVKRAGVKKATPREQAYLDEIIAAGGIGFVADDVQTVIDIMEQVKHVRTKCR